MKAVKRTQAIPEYVFSRLDELKSKLEAQGRTVINLGIGDPDTPTPSFIVECLERALKHKGAFNYPPYEGIKEFREAVCYYYYDKFRVELDPDTQVAALIGSKEGIAHAILGLTDPGDNILIPDIGYPVYSAAAAVAGCTCSLLHLREDRGYMPDLDEINEEEKPRLVIVNYPNNPTGAVANPEFFTRLTGKAHRMGMVAINDGAYMDIVREGTEPSSILATENGMDNALEFGSLSKSFNMTGWRIGFAAGSRDAIKELMSIKTNFDSGQFIPIQKAAAMALRQGAYYTKGMNELYSQRRKRAEECLNNMGLKCFRSYGTFYIWFKVPEGFTSVSFSEYVLMTCGIIITPGSAFNLGGEGYCRISLTVPDQILDEALKKISMLSICP
jgi:LL-diaminopimelate aminotransferase